MWMTLTCYLGILAAVATQLPTSSAAAQKSVEPSLPALVVTPLTGMEISGVQGELFSPTLFQYHVSASIGIVRYSIRTPSWLTTSSSFDTVDTTGVTITLSVNATAVQLAPGTYRLPVAFTNVTNGHGTTTRTATLIVRAPSSRPPSAGIAQAPSISHPPPVGHAFTNGGGYLLDGSGRYLLDDRGGRLLAQ